MQEIQLQLTLAEVNQILAALGEKILQGSVSTREQDSGASLGPIEYCASPGRWLAAGMKSIFQAAHYEFAYAAESVADVRCSDTEEYYSS